MFPYCLGSSASNLSLSDLSLFGFRDGSKFPSLFSLSLHFVIGIYTNSKPFFLIDSSHCLTLLTFFSRAHNILNFTQQVRSAFLYISRSIFLPRGHMTTQFNRSSFSLHQQVHIFLLRTHGNYIQQISIFSTPTDQYFSLDDKWQLYSTDHTFEDT